MTSLDIKIGYFGQKKSGKSSIINYVFQNMPRKQTLNLQSTTNPTTVEYTSSLLKIANFEIPGKYDSLDKLSAEDFERLKQQDVFIYVFDLRSGDPESAVKQLKSQLAYLTKVNPNFLFYIFFHQADLDFLYLGNKIEESINFFRRKFENLIREENFDVRLLERYHIKKTSIYDFSINAGDLTSPERCDLQRLGGEAADHFHDDLKCFQVNRPLAHLPVRHQYQALHRQRRRPSQRLANQRTFSSCSWTSSKCTSTSLLSALTRSTEP